MYLILKFLHEFFQEKSILNLSKVLVLIFNLEINISYNSDSALIDMLHEDIIFVSQVIGCCEMSMRPIGLVV